jgi:hypothetical protein
MASFGINNATKMRKMSEFLKIIKRGKSQKKGEKSRTKESRQMSPKEG